MSKSKKKNSKKKNKSHNTDDLDKELNELIEKNESIKTGMVKLFEKINSESKTNKSDKNL